MDLDDRQGLELVCQVKRALTPYSETPHGSVGSGNNAGE